MHPSSFLFASRCWDCDRLLGSASLLCFACNRRAIRGLADPAADYLLPHEFPGALAALRAGAPRRAAHWFFRLLETHRCLERWGGVGVVVTAPRAKAREGEDGLAVLADLVAAHLGAARAPALVKKSAHRQHGQKAEARYDAPLFVFPGPAIQKVKGKRVLLFDDVRTTGTTEEMAAFQLRNEGAAAVEAFALVEQVVNGFDREDRDTSEEGQEVQPLLLHLAM